MRVLLFLVGCLGLAGCEYYDRPNKPLPKDFTLLREDGTLLQRKDFLGHPWVIHVWLPGCHVCAREMAEVEKLRKKYEGKGVEFLSLSLVPDTAKSRIFMKGLGVDMQLAMSRGEVLDPLAVKQAPSTVFLNREGVIVKAATGPRRASSMEARILELLEN